MRLSIHNSKIFIVAAVLLLPVFSACDKLSGVSANPQSQSITQGNFLSQILSPEQEKIKATKISFSPDYKTFTITADILQDIGAYELSDSSKVKTEVVETLDGIRLAHVSTPSLVKIKNIEAECIQKEDVRMLLLVDRSLPQANLDAICSYAKEMKTIFKYDNLFVAFMDSTVLSPTMKLTDYVLDNYFKKSHCNYCRLYRSVLQKSDEMRKQDGYWQGANKNVLIIFSDGKVYHDDSDNPIDPEHYRLQEILATSDSTKNDTSFYAYYVNLDQQQDSFEEEEDNIMLLFCNNNGGTIVKNFLWTSFKNDMLNNLHCESPDYLLYFENPDFKVYRGDNTKLTLKFFDAQTDSLIASVSAIATVGALFKPIIVHGHSIFFVILQGLFLGAILLLFVYLVLQFLVPFIKNKIFLHKYVISYTGQNMSFDNKAVAESCYLCKAPFETGDSIVVKCEHTMHKSCWDENGYHCPEYSDRCKQGSHYYNSHNLLDHHNAPFYFKWLFVAITAATLAWFCFSLCQPIIYSFSPNIITLQPPLLGILLGFFLSFGISTLTLRPGKDFHALARIFLRSAIVAAACFLCFLLVDLVIFLFDIHHLVLFLNWIPWTASGFIIAYLSHTHARTFSHSRIIFLLIGVLLGFLSMNVWNFFFRYFEIDSRVLLLISFCIFSIGLIACIAAVAPRSERYFLKVQGATKGTDIALYKWFRNNPEKSVTLGKSVDSTIQLSWDIQSDIAPIQAEIRLIKQTPYLIPLEPGVYCQSRPARVNKKIRLYHGKSFTIGKTTFSYIEKDR